MKFRSKNPIIIDHNMDSNWRRFKQIEGSIDNNYEKN
jgi:hypothetical protein